MFPSALELPLAGSPTLRSFLARVIFFGEVTCQSSGTWSPSPIHLWGRFGFPQSGRDFSSLIGEFQAGAAAPLSLSGRREARGTSSRNLPAAVLPPLPVGRGAPAGMWGWGGRREEGHFLWESRTFPPTESLLRKCAGQTFLL